RSSSASRCWPSRGGASMADVTMPQLGETVTEGTITRWFKQVGDQVAADEPLFEVSTDKVDSEVPAPASGVVSDSAGGAAPAAAPAEAPPEPAPAPVAADAPPPPPAAPAPAPPPPVEPA